MLDIVVPVYNEGENIQKLFDEIALKIQTKKRVIIVYDFDEDNTVLVVQELKDKYAFEIVLQKNMYARGALSAIKTGFHCSTADMVLVMMADLSDSLETVDIMVSLMERGNEIVCGSRYMRGGKQLGGPVLKKIISRTAGASLHLLIRIPTHDVTNSFKLYSRKVLEQFEIESTGGFELGMELTVKSYVNGLRIAETPSIWNDRVTGKSKFKMWEWLPRYLHWYLYGIVHTWFVV